MLSLIDPEWPQPDCFNDWLPDRWLLLRFHDDIGERENRDLPTEAHVATILQFGRKITENRDSQMFVHCLSGVSRSTAAAVMIWAQDAPQMSEQAIFEHLAREYPKAWPNSLMISMADERLGRQGRLVSALHDHYRQRLLSDPSLEQSMRRIGRAGEIIR